MKLRSFAIIEIIVTLAIITILATIVIPDLWATQQRVTGEMFMNNVHDIVTTLELYKKENEGLYPAQLEDLASYYDRQPVNQYTKNSMLTSNSSQSGIEYTPSSDYKSYTLIVTQRDINDLDRDKNRIETVPEALGQPFIFSNVTPVTPTIARTYIITLLTNPDKAGNLSAIPNPAKANQTVILSQTPNNCYEFNSWLSSDVTISGNSFVMPAQNITVTANYTLKQYNVSVAPNNTSYGTVTGSGTYNCDSTATLTAEPNTGYTFVGWYEGSKSVTTATTYIFTVNSDRTLEARFGISASSYTITIVYEAEVSPSGNIATVSKNPASPGESVTLTIDKSAISSCYLYGGWRSPDLGQIKYNLSSTSYTFTMPAQNVTIYIKLPTNPNHICW